MSVPTLRNHFGSRPLLRPRQHTMTEHLPTEWERAWSGDEHRIFYRHRRLIISTWEKPSDNLSNWSVFWSEELCRRYYYHNILRVSTWTEPTDNVSISPQLLSHAAPHVTADWESSARLRFIDRGTGAALDPDIICMDRGIEAHVPLLIDGLALPQGYRAVWSKAHKDVFFWDTSTGTVQWEVPETRGQPWKPVPLVVEGRSVDDPQPARPAVLPIPALAEISDFPERFERLDWCWRCRLCWKTATEDHLKSREHLCNIRYWRDQIPALAALPDTANDMQVQVLELRHLLAALESLRRSYLCLRPCSQKPADTLPELVREWRRSSKRFKHPLRMFSEVEDCSTAVLNWQCWFAVRHIPIEFLFARKHKLVFKTSASDDVAEAGSESEATCFLFSFHGCRIFGLRSILKNGLSESVNEGGRHAAHGAGIYSSPRLATARYYATPGVVFPDGRLWQVILHCRLRKPHTRLINGRWGPEYITSGVANAVITHVTCCPSELPGRAADSCARGYDAWLPHLEA